MQKGKSRGMQRQSRKLHTQQWRMGHGHFSFLLTRRKDLVRYYMHTISILSSFVHDKKFLQMSHAFCLCVFCSWGGGWPFLLWSCDPGDPMRGPPRTIAHYVCIFSKRAQIIGLYKYSAKYRVCSPVMISHFFDCRRTKSLFVSVYYYGLFRNHMW